MKSVYLSLLFLLLSPAFAGAQAISINTDASNPDPSAILDVKSSDKGMLVPRMTTAQRTAIAAPATGLLVYDTDIQSFWFFNGTAWTNIAGGGTPTTFIADSDGNTKVQTEKAANEDIIRFDLGGTESMVLRQDTNGNTRLELPSVLGNTFVGQGAGNGNALTHSNTAIGAEALSNNTFGVSNTASGYQALYTNTAGYENTANGNAALHNNSIGYHNTASGAAALLSNTTGNNNTALGSGADVTTGDLNKATAIGYNAKVGCSNCLVLGGTGADAVKVGIGTTIPAGLECSALKNAWLARVFDPMRTAGQSLPPSIGYA